MKKIKIFYIHEKIDLMNNDQEKVNALLEDICHGCKFDDIEFVWDNRNPDYLFVSELIYYTAYAKKAKKLYANLIKNNPITIFVAGECIEPDLNIYDYAIVFNRNIKYFDRIGRIPTWMRFHKSVLERTNSIKTIDNASIELSKKKKFCNFIYSNSKAHPMRDKLFFEISRYKNVDSLGKHLKNADIEEDIGKIKDWRLQSIKVKEQYKFTIASENASYPGYISEKLLTSFQAHSVPIYWGDPDVALEFNEKAFINCNRYKNIDEIVQTIKKINENDELWENMISEPWMTEEQEKKYQIEQQEYINFLENIFYSPKEDTYRKASGYHPDNYRRAFLNKTEKIKLKDQGRKILRKLKQFFG